MFVVARRRRPVVRDAIDMMQSICQLDFRSNPEPDAHRCGKRSADHARSAQSERNWRALQGHPRLEPVDEAGITCTPFAQAAKTGPSLDTHLDRTIPLPFSG
jgi:hypothetical protein